MHFEMIDIAFIAVAAGVIAWRIYVKGQFPSPAKHKEAVDMWEPHIEDFASRVFKEATGAPPEVSVREASFDPRYHKHSIESTIFSWIYKDTSGLDCAIRFELTYSKENSMTAFGDDSTNYGLNIYYAWEKRIRVDRPDELDASMEIISQAFFDKCQEHKRNRRKEG